MSTSADCDDDCQEEQHQRCANHRATQKGRQPPWFARRRDADIRREASADGHGELGFLQGRP